MTGLFAARFPAYRALWLPLRRAVRVTTIVLLSSEASRACTLPLGRAGMPEVADPVRPPEPGKPEGMLAIIAAIIFGIAFVINATGAVTDRAFSVTGLLFLGLAFLALHQAGIGSAWVRRR